ncbi:MAG: SDR family NAD(P)-dependent oxidoreductase [Bacteroidota bacterium]
MNIIVTGGHSGIGLELSKMLLNEGHKLGLILRNEKRKEDALAALGTDKDIEFFYADLSKQKEVVNVAETIKNQWDIVNGLFNNAGVLLDQAYYSDQGNEMHFEINTLAPYLLAQKLMPLLEQTHSGFVVTTVTGSLHQRNETSLNVNELKRPTKFVKLLGSYMQSKFAVAQLMNYMARNHSNVKFVNVDPGPNRTGMTAGEGMPFLLKPLAKILFPKPIKGATKLYRGAFDDQYEGSGIYITSNKITPLKYDADEATIQQMLDAVVV